jgi:hypothetical protein
VVAAVLRSSSVAYPDPETKRHLSYLAEKSVVLVNLYNEVFKFLGSKKIFKLLFISCYSPVMYLKICQSLSALVLGHRIWIQNPDPGLDQDPDQELSAK